MKYFSTTNHVRGKTKLSHVALKNHLLSLKNKIQTIICNYHNFNNNTPQKKNEKKGHNSYNKRQKYNTYQTDIQQRHSRFHVDLWSNSTSQTAQNYHLQNHKYPHVTQTTSRSHYPFRQSPKHDPFSDHPHIHKTKKNQKRFISTHIKLITFPQSWLPNNTS